jgi:hypothetical protein
MLLLAALFPVSATPDRFVLFYELLNVALQCVDVVGVYFALKRSSGLTTLDMKLLALGLGAPRARGAAPGSCTAAAGCNCSSCS